MSKPKDSHNQDRKLKLQSLAHEWKRPLFQVNAFATPVSRIRKKPAEGLRYISAILGNRSGVCRFLKKEKG